MKTSYFPYDIEHIKNFLSTKNYYQSSFMTFHNYKKIILFLYPKLSRYYVRKAFLELLNDNFLIMKKINGKRQYRLKNIEFNLFKITWD